MACLILEEEDLVKGEYFKVTKYLLSPGMGRCRKWNKFEIYKIQDDELVASVEFDFPFNTHKIVFKDRDFKSIFCLDSTTPLMIEEYKNCVEFARNALRDISCK